MKKISKRTLRMWILLLTGIVELVLNLFVIKQVKYNIIFSAFYPILSTWVMFGKICADMLGGKIISPNIEITNVNMVNIINNKSVFKLDAGLGKVQLQKRKLSRILDQGIVLYTSGNEKGALKLFTKGLAMSRKAGNVEFSIVNMVNLAFSKLKFKEYDESIELLEGVITESIDSEIPLMSAKAHYMLTYVYWKKKELGEALRHAEKALSIYQELGYLYGITLTLDYIASIQYTMGDICKARTNFDKNLGNALKCGEIELQAHAHSFIGIIQHAKGNYAAAIDSHKKAAKLLSDSGRSKTEDYLGIRGELANVFNSLERYEDALAIYSNIVRVCKERNYNQLLGKVLLSTSAVYGNQDKAEIALEYLNNAEQYFLQYEYNDLNYLLNKQAVFLCIMKNDLAEALKRVMKSFGYAEKSDNKRYLADSHFMEGYVLSLLGGSSSEISTSMELASQLYFEIGDAINQADAKVNKCISRLLNKEDKIPLFAAMEEALAVYEKEGEIVQYSIALNLYLKALLILRCFEKFASTYNRLGEYTKKLCGDSPENKEALSQLKEIDQIMKTIRDKTTIPIQLLLLAKTNQIR